MKYKKKKKIHQNYNQIIKENKVKNIIYILKINKRKKNMKFFKTLI